MKKSHLGAQTVFHEIRSRSLQPPFPSPGEVGLESPCTGVLDTDHVGVVGPHVLEELLEDGLVLDLHVLLQHAQAAEDGLQVGPGQHALDDVGAVEAVDTVGPEDSGLSEEEGALPLLEEVAELLLVGRQPVQQDGQTVPSGEASRRQGMQDPRT